MDLRNEEHKKRLKINVRPIITLLIVLGFLSAVISAAMIAASQNTDNQKAHSKNNQADNQNAVADETSDTTLFAVVQEIDKKNKQITLFDVDQQEAYILSYSGGTDITDKYGKAITINQIALGTMVDASYQQDINKLTGMNISKKAWEYDNVNNMNIDLEKQIMKIAATKYKFNDDIFVFDGKDSIMVDELREQDVLTVWGYNETIWSVVIAKGHGTVKLKDDKDYLGDFITIGYEAVQQITEDMEITVREGDFNLTVENGKYSAMKPITVKRNEVTYVSLKDLGPDGLKFGQVTFEITPNGADLYIDGELTSYSDPVDLNFGEHAIAATLGGYTSYKGTIDVDATGKSIRIDLPEASSEDAAVVTETNADADADNTSTGTGKVSSGTDSSASDDHQTSSDNSAQADSTTGKSHLIYAQSPKGASVYLDGKYMGTSPCSFKKITGSHVITFLKDGYRTTSYTVDVADDGKDAYFTFPDMTKKK